MQLLLISFVLFYHFNLKRIEKNFFKNLDALHLVDTVCFMYGDYNTKSRLGRNYNVVLRGSKIFVEMFFILPGCTYPQTAS